MRGPEVDDETFFARVDQTLRGQMACPDCGLDILIFDRDSLPADVRDYITSNQGEIQVTFGPREGCIVFALSDGELFNCPRCDHSFVAAFVPPN